MKSNKVGYDDLKLLKLIAFFVVLLVSVASVVCSYFLIVNSTSRYGIYLKTLKSGYIADENVYVKSSVDIKDFDATQRKLEQVRQSVPPVFTFSQKKMISILTNFETISSGVDNASTVKAASYEILKSILQKGFYTAEDMSRLEASQTQFIDVMGPAGSNGLVSVDSLLYSSNIDDFIIEKIDSDYVDSFDSTEKLEIRLLVRSCLEPDTFFDSVLTEEHILKAVDATDPVIISLKKGDILIEKDTVIKDSQLELLSLLSRQGRASLYDLAGDFVLCVLSYGMSMAVFLYFVKENRFHCLQYTVILGILLLFNIVYTYFALYLSTKFLPTDFPDAFMPVSLVPLYISMITGKKRYGFIASFMVAVTASIMPQSSVYTFFYVGMSACAVVVVSRFLVKRIDYLSQWLLSVLICSGIMVVFIFLSTSSYTNVINDLIGVFLQVTFASLLISVSVPVVESVFNLPTDYRLHELAFTDSPLLNRLSKAAPGTYNHSRQVAELAYDAALAIGANGLLARVGGLYHDIGKTEHPEYFIENQGGGANKHDDISPSLSVSVLKSHVSIGAEMAKEAHLPIEITSIVANHHGNDMIYYFYREALKNQNSSTGEVQSSDYSYNNSKIPSFRECAIVMLADSVEAAARTVAEPTTAKFAKLIRSIVIGKVERHQLTDSNLTFKDLANIEKSFLKTLSAQHHARIEYPDEDKEKEKN